MPAAVTAKTAHRAVSRLMPRVARPHEEVDLDRTKASVSKKKKRREFSDVQRKALIDVYMLHLVRGRMQYDLFCRALNNLQVVPSYDWP